MSEERTRTVRVEMSDTTARQLAELVPAVAHWAAETGGEPRTGPGDVIALAIAVFHAQICERTHDMLAAAQAEREAGATVN